METTAKNDTHGIGAASAGIAGSDSETPNGRVIRELTATANRTARAISRQHWALTFTLGGIAAAIRLLEQSPENINNVLKLLRRTHANGCQEQDALLDGPNMKAQP